MMENEITQKCLSWCRNEENIRAVILTSSRANSEAKKDALSDWDIEIYAQNISFFRESDIWFESFGDVLVRWPLKPETTWSEEWITRLVQYRNGIRIDFQITDNNPQYHDNFDAGYQILIDKDKLCNNFGLPRKENLFIKPPTEQDFAERLNAFFWDILYVAKVLKRDELFYAKYMLDNICRFHMQQVFIEWHIGSMNNWAVGTNKYGRQFREYLKKNEWAEIEKTFAGAGIEENRRAMNAMFENVVNLARDIAGRMGIAYPLEQEREVAKYIKEIHGMHL